MKKTLAISALALIFLLNLTPSVQAGRIVLTNDEWMLTDYGFSQVGTDPGQFARNVANWFSGDGSGNFLVYSNNFGLTGTSLAGVMTGAGNTWTVASSVDSNPSLIYLNSFDGIFLAGNAVNNSTLIDYVKAGGNVFLAGGTGWGGAAAEAERWKTFLNEFGLEYGTSYNGVAGNIPLASGHPIFAGVGSLYQNNGNDILLASTPNPNAQILITYNNHGLYAVYDSGIPSVPEAGVIFLLGTGLAALIGLRRKCKK